MEPRTDPGAPDGAALDWLAGGSPVATPHAEQERAAIEWLGADWSAELARDAWEEGEEAGGWPSSAEPGSERVSVVDEAEIWPAIAAILPAVISAAPAVIDAVTKLTAPKPAPAPPRPAPTPPRAPAPARTPTPPPPQAATPRPVPPPARPPTTPSPVPRDTALAPGGSSSDVVDLLRRLADLVPQLTALLAAPTAREWIQAYEHEAVADGGPRLREQAASPPGPSGVEQTGTQRAGAEHRPTGSTRADGAERDVPAETPEAQDERGPPTGSRGRDLSARAVDVTDLVPLPDRSTINVGVSPCPTSLLVSRFGRPRDLLTVECQAMTSPFWRDRMTTGEVGTFRVRGHHQAVALLQSAFASLRTTDPDLHDRIGSSGMLCVRHVRGVPGVISNHALGLALDVTIDGRTDIRGDDQVQRGLLRLHEVLAPFGVFWGAGLRSEDAIHFEIGAEVVHRWIEQGSF